jgi:hypothetical protein
MDVTRRPVPGGHGFSRLCRRFPRRSTFLGWSSRLEGSPRPPDVRLSHPEGRGGPLRARHPHLEGRGRPPGGSHPRLEGSHGPLDVSPPRGEGSGCPPGVGPSHHDGDPRHRGAGPSGVEGSRRPPGVGRSRDGADVALGGAEHVETIENGSIRSTDIPHLKAVKTIDRSCPSHLGSRATMEG